MEETSAADLLSTALSAGASSTDEQIFLVSKCGRRFSVNAELLNVSSEYFSLVLKSGMTEAEQREIKFSDVTAEVLQALIKGMLTTKNNRAALCKIKLFNNVNSQNVIPLLEFSARLFMPWIGICCAQKAAQESDEVELLLDLVTWKSTFEDEAEKNLWDSVVKIAISRMALAENIVKAWHLPGFGKLEESQLMEILYHVSSGPWTRQTFSVALTDDMKTRSGPDAHGNFIMLRKTQLGDVGVYVDMEQAKVERTFKLGDLNVAMVEARFEALPNDEYLVRPLRGDVNMIIVPEVYNFGRPDFIRASDVQNFSCDGSSVFKISLETRISHREYQWAALRAFYARRVGVSPENVCMGDVWRHYHDKNPAVARTCRDLLCRAFISAQRYPPFSFWESLNCFEVESIISQDSLFTGQKEVRVLQAVIRWAMSKSHSKQRFGIGEVVIFDDKRLDHFDRGLYCVVKKRSRKSHSLHVKYVAGFGRVLKVPCDGVYDASQAGMMRLLDSIRSDYIPIEHLRTELQDEEIAFAMQFESYREFVRNIIRVQTGLGSYSGARGRDGYGPLYASHDQVVGSIWSLLHRDVTFPTEQGSESSFPSSESDDCEDGSCSPSYGPCSPVYGTHERYDPYKTRWPSPDALSSPQSPRRGGARGGAETSLETCSDGEEDGRATAGTRSQVKRQRVGS
jgi:hypothetical protein